MLDRIGNCRVLKEVASGGMAVVYKAFQDDLKRTVAIKALKTSVAFDHDITTRFEREAQSLANLQHENIIHIYNFHRAKGALFIVMEYVEGIDLYDLLDECGRLPFDAGAIIAMQVARALDYIHYRGIVHRDIKPANVMLSRQGAVKLMDFGIALDRAYDDELTEVGAGIGTPSYMSPEQIRGEELDARSDIFSLGVLLYQMVTGKKPFVEDAEMSVTQKIRSERHARVRKLNDEVPRELERIIDKCLHKDPGNRFRSAQALIVALERFIGKHVEMNYHARLVLYLKDQERISQIEADEYLNPALGGAGASALAQPLIQAKRLVRQGVTVQAAIFAVVALMIGLIHLAPVGAELPAPVVSVEQQVGYVQIVVNPWGRVLVDGEEVAVTPIALPLQIEAGQHSLTITNDYFEPYRRTIDVAQGTEDHPIELFIDLERLSTPVENFEVED